MKEKTESIEEYSPEGWEEEEIEVGKVIDALVISIENGTLENLVNDFKKFNVQGNANPDQPAIKILTDANTDLLIALPKDKKYHPKSKLGRWIKTYGAAPKIGQKVKCMMDAEGFYRIVLQ